MSTKINLKQLAQARKKKIDSPLAKYNSGGQLFCVLCNVQVKDEVYWTGHISGRGHKDKLKEKKDRDVFKRPAPPPDIGGGDEGGGDVDGPPMKMVKVVDEREESVKVAEEELKRMMSGEIKVIKVDEKGEDGEGESNEGEKEEGMVQKESLPAGFFDDPKEDAKARGMKFRDPQDVEWDKFVKEIASEDIKSNEIVGEEQEKSAVERDLEHIEEQMAQWQRVIDLEKKAQEYAKQKSEKPEVDEREKSMDVDNDEDEDDEDYEEDLDWRNKKR